ncbi:PREDICTED: uncharacterized protein LOC105363351 [Ceratosolen solmsi marchali]|uniref:Uncharacterized protein LOC105363351 n=1 Tax=Ceratosolen solmsi marchali TaxID=326594 RepID=A0AAJ7DWU2_9HYME|nr:PREDICTED: uncharacterized protein LOC105363351 [Ceratosolen solmsi marchali]
MCNYENRATMKLFSLICLICVLAIIEADVINNIKLYDGKIKSSMHKNNANENDHKMVHLIEQQMLLLNKSGDAARDKRALGILLQGFMEALGYTVTPLQVASLANPAPMSQMSPMKLQPKAPMPMAPAKSNATSATATLPPRQRETLRFTGVLNFGNNVNTSNLVNHLAQYEQLFHRNGSVGLTAPPPASAPKSKIDPRSQQPLPEPLFVKIPLPIAPSLLPSQPQLPISLQNNYRDEYANDQEKVYQSNRNTEGNQGDYEEEDDKSQHSEEYEHKQEIYHEPKDKNYEYDSYEKPNEKNSEKEYKNNKKIVNYSVENKEIYDPSEVSEEVPITNTKFRHTMYVNEPDWKKNHEEQLYKLAAEQEAHAEALAEENSKRENNRNREHELDEENNDFHNSREKEISDHNEEKRARYEIISKKQPYYNENNEDDSGSSEKENYNRNREENDNDDYQEESNVSDTPPIYTRYEETATDISKENRVVTDKYVTQDYDKYTSSNNGPSSDYHKVYVDSEEQKKRQENEPNKYYFTVPINYDQENSQPDHTLRDSYGESLENPNGKVDERVSSYFTMFKNPETGIYDPNRIREYESSRIPYDHIDLVKGFKRIQNEYGLPENKYEEYDINHDKIEHRAKSYSQGLSTKKHKQEKSANESKKSLTKVQPEIMNCDCNTKKIDGQSEEARNHGKSVTTGLLPSRISEVPTNYHSTVKYQHEPVDYDQSIIARLTSYNQPITARFEDTGKYTNTPSYTTLYQRQTTIRPIESTSRVKLTTERLLQETESKEIRAWPAPFDYAFDNSDRNDVIFNATPTTNLYKTLNNQSPVYAIPYDKTKSNCYQAHLLPAKNFANNFQLLQRDNENIRYNIDNRNKRQRRPTNSSKNTRVNNNRQQMSSSILKKYDSTLPPPSAKDDFEQGRQRQSDMERSVNYENGTGTPTNPAQTGETLTPHPEGSYITKIPPQEWKNRHRPESVGNQKNQKVVKVQTKKNYDNYPPVNNKSSSNLESSNYVEKDGILIIPEPTPYYYNERVDEFTDEPLNEAENVKIKEYRNRIESVKVSNLKRLYPTASTQVLRLSSNL